MSYGFGDMAGQNLTNLQKVSFSYISLFFFFFHIFRWAPITYLQNQPILMKLHMKVDIMVYVD